jgi:NSS family neurotransmitter:Na+ symporter
MPGGRLIGTLFFVLLSFAALTPSIAGIEPLVAWLEQRHRMRRAAAVLTTAAAAWIVGLGSVLSFNRWSSWHPFGAIPRFATMTFFDLMDFISSNVLLPVGALLVSAFLGWFLAKSIPAEELDAMSPLARRTVLFSLRYVTPVAISAVLISAIL